MAPTKGPDRNPSGLGRAIINKKAKDAKRMQETGLYTTDLDSTSKLKSITQEKDLDAFLNTAELAGTEFTAEKRNVKIIQQASTSQNPYLLSEQEEKEAVQRQDANRKRLRVPRRPPWKKFMSTAQLDRQEKTAFLEWRRGLADLQDRDQFLLTPFERNIEVWRQLWRVIERSHLVVQIVDARNPLRFRCEDLEDYVRDVEGSEGESGSGPGKRKSLLLINKSDLLTATQRREWADYFDKQGIQYAFFSAANATALQEARAAAAAAAEEVSRKEESKEDDDEEMLSDDEGFESASESSESDDEHYFSAEEDTADGQDPRARVLSVLELEDLFMKCAPPLSDFKDLAGNTPTRLTVGLVGYPNVGKSSTINSLLGEKKVSVSATPGKTKHFQTINLSANIMLCDCPGLVFPQFATTKADLVCDGVLPIDQLREHTGPMTLVVKRVPKEVLEAVYGLQLDVLDSQNGGDGNLTAETLLKAYAIARGFMRSGQGNPDEARAARYILKDYVTAKLLYCHPPPGVSEAAYNEQSKLLALRRSAGKKRAPTTRVGKNADTFVAMNNPATPGAPVGPKNLDDDFFNQQAMAARPSVAGKGTTGFSRNRVYPHQNMVADDGTPLTGRRARIASVLAANGGDLPTGKKHHKKPRRQKQRSGKGYD
ncbi:P-loop containing nucleoside triphosphate hydrolase protein [Schizophyllum commune Tattone D]|nr:P-loop containing nucleoside triphosphate hydrolase protein [Schizophyllum commune Tattone D]